MIVPFVIYNRNILIAACTYLSPLFLTPIVIESNISSLSRTVFPKIMCGLRPLVNYCDCFNQRYFNMNHYECDNYAQKDFYIIYFIFIKLLQSNQFLYERIYGIRHSILNGMHRFKRKITMFNFV